jgi:hypothetical protein
VGAGSLGAPGRVEEQVSIRFDRIPDNRALSEKITSKTFDAIISGEYCARMEQFLEEIKASPRARDAVEFWLCGA